MRRGLAMALGLVLLFASAARAATSDVGTAHGFANLAVDWPAPVALFIETRGERVEIQASRPFPADLLDRAVALQPLLAMARLNDTATILELHAAAGMTIETAILDDRSLKIALTPTAAPKLGLRLGRHPDFERVVIEPMGEHQMQLRQDGSRLTVTLPGSLRPADRARLADVAGIERLVAAGNRLFIDLAPGTRPRPLFVGPDRQVLDFYAPATASRPLAEPATRSAGSMPAEAATSSRASNPPPEPVPESDRPAPQSLTQVPAPWAPPSFPELQISASRLADDSVELSFAWPEPVPAAVFVRGAQLWVAFAANNAGIVLDRDSFTGAARRFIGALREESHPEATLIRLGLTDQPTIDVRRDGPIWRVVLGAATSDAGDRQQVLPPTAGDAGPLSFGLLLPAIDATVSLTDPIVGDRLGIGMAREPTGWRTAPARFVGLRLLPAAQGAVWRQLTEPTGDPTWTTAGLFFGPADGVVRTGRTGPALPAPLIDALPMALDVPPEQPLPAVDRADSATTTEIAQALDDPQAPSAPDPPAAIGETSSLGPPAEALPTIVVEPDPTPGPLALARFRAGAGRGFWDHRSALLEAAGAADRQGSAELTLDLARLHVAYGLGPEATSLLADMAAPSPIAGPSAAWLALNGAADFLAGRHAAALGHLAHAELRADDETALWRGATLAALERWDEALADWQRGEPWLAGYEPAVQARLAEHGVLLLLQTGRIDEAFASLERLAALHLPQAASERLRELEAIALERDGAIDEARTIWRALSSAGSPEARSRALLSLTFSDLEAGRIEAAEAIDRLTADSVHWRGQSDEVAKRRRLAGLQHSAGLTDAALATLEDAMSGDPPANTAALITADMAAIVDGLFAAFAQGERSATATLLLYRRYAELVASGTSGDAKVQALAAALSELGLDDAAIDILRSRMQRREARDAGRAALGFALAELLVRKGDGRGAMAALIDSTPIATIDDRLADARRSLFAAIGGAGSSDPAETGARASTMREQARRAFDRRAWAEVVEATATLEAALSPSGSLDAAATEIVLLAATAARQLGDEPTVERLVAGYGERLATAADNAVLRLLAENARFSGAAGDVLGEATGYTRAMRSAIAGMPSL